MKTALEEAGEDVRHYYDLWKAALAREARLRASLDRLVNVAQEFTFHDAGPHWDELCCALAEARALLRAGEGRA